MFSNASRQENAREKRGSSVCSERAQVLVVAVAGLSSYAYGTPPERAKCRRAHVHGLLRRVVFFCALFSRRLDVHQPCDLEGALDVWKECRSSVSANAEVSRLKGKVLRCSGGGLVAEGSRGMDNCNNNVPNMF
jgi:hypothetical protein